MNQMRYDWLSDRWVIFAPNRLSRPDDFATPLQASPAVSTAPCPFCRGYEKQTPNPTLVLRPAGADPSSEEWLVRVVPNKFPAVTHTDHHCSDEHDCSGDNQCSGHHQYSSQSRHSGESQRSELARVGLGLAGVGEAFARIAPGLVEPSAKHSPENLFLKRQTSGAHEVFIESPNHVSSITALPVDHVALIYQAYQERLLAYRRLGTMRYGVVFKNYGMDAGASLLHTHSQLICTDFLPSDVSKVQRRMQQYMEEHRRCYVCDVIEQEIQNQERIVSQSEHFVALCPFASRLPYSVSIVPKRHQSQFEASSQELRDDLARITMRVLSAIETEHPRAAYNTILQTAPFDLASQNIFHWRMKIIPRLCKVAGFEWSSDCFINTVTPEEAARRLRARCEACAPCPVPVLGEIGKPVYKTTLADRDSTSISSLSERSRNGGIQ